MNLYHEHESESNLGQGPVKIPHDEPYSTTKIADHLSRYLEPVPAYQDIVIVCIGTDRSTGDALGPLVGSRLKKYNFTDIHLFGTLDEPVHAMNLDETIRLIHSTYPDPFVIGIDACLGQSSSVGSVQIGNGPLKPGAGVKKDLPPVGKIHITGVVNVGGFMEYFVLQNTRLSLVFQMAEVIARAIYMSLIQTKRLAPFSLKDLKLPSSRHLDR